MTDTEPMNKDELIDKIAEISGFLVGWGTAAELAAERLRRLMDEMDQRGLAACDPEAPDQ